MRTEVVPRTIINVETSLQIADEVYRLLSTKQLVITNGDSKEALLVTVQEAPREQKKTN